MKLRKVLSAVAAAAVATTAFAAVASATDYNAYIGFQTTTYSFRNSWDEGNYGKATPYFDGFVVWGDGDNPEETFPEYEDNFNYDINGYVLPASYTDAVISGDGTYRVKAEGIDWDLKGESDFNLVFVSTDIPMDAGVTCTSATIYVDGNAVKTVENPVCDETQAYFGVYLANIWNADIGSYGLAFPTESLEVEFTLTGLGSAAEEAPAEEEAPATTGDVDAATDSTKGSPDTGVADVAAVAGLAVLAGGAFIVAKKRK